MRARLLVTFVFAACTSDGGPQGDPGPTGPQGPAGPAGGQGEPGLKGDLGATGPVGLMGTTGPQGTQGMQGPAGEVWVVDGGVVTGPPGASVRVTAIAPDGATCPTGGLRVTQLSDGGISNVCNGAQGPAGPAPSVSTLPMMSPACATGGVLVGQPDGGALAVCNGAQGPQGLQGLQGLSGSTGGAGPSGPAGPTGNTGPAGPAGPTGTVGPAGQTGPQGAAGAVLYVDGGVVVLSSAPVEFVGFTTATFTGNLGGVPGANQKCQAQFPSSYFCTIADYDRSNTTVVPSTAAGAWIDFDRAPSGSRDTGSCAQNGSAWANASTPFQAFGPYLTNTGGYYTTALCSLSKPAACCRGGAAPTTFRGFTTATFTGNLGGVPGANLKCQAQFPGSIFCTIADYDRANTTVVPSTVAGAWIDFDRAVSGSRSTSSCAQNGSAWANAATPFQAFGPYLTNTGGYYTTALCSLSKPLSCCSP